MLEHRIKKHNSAQFFGTYLVCHDVVSLSLKLFTKNPVLKKFYHGKEIHPYTEISQGNEKTFDTESCLTSHVESL